MGRRAALILTASLLAQAGVPGTAAGEVTATPPRLSMSAEAAMDVAARLVGERRYAQADEILRTLAVAEAPVDPVRLDVLAAEIALRSGEPARAQDVFTSVLDHDPELAEARFGLGLALFEQRRDRRAEHHLRLAGPSLPPPLQKQAGEALAAIRDRRVFTASLSAAIAPDTNVNTATSEREQTVFGAEQVLNDDGALARAGIGLSTTLNLGATPRIRGRLRGQAETTVHLSDQSNAELDFLSYEAALGPRWQGDRVSGSVLGTVGRQRFGGEAFSESYGARAQVTARLTKRLRATANVAVRRTDFLLSDAQDGVTVSASTSISRPFGSRTLIGAFAAGIRHEAEAGTQSYWRTGGGVTASREVAGGVTLRLTPSAYWRRADEVAPAFGVRREDLTYAASLSATKRGLSFGGLSPLLTYAYTVNDSTVSFYDFDRHRVDLGFTRAF